MSAPDIGVQAGMTRQTVHRLLQQLEAIGMVRRDGERERFETGPALSDIGLLTLIGNHTAKLRRAVMEKLVAEINENSNLAVLDDREVLYIDNAESTWPFRRVDEIGSRMPAYCTGVGKVILAHLPASALEDYLARTSLERWTNHTWTEPEAFREHLMQIHEQGYAINDEENQLGHLSVAVPVRDPLDRVVAGLSIHGAKVRLTKTRARAIVPKLMVAARAISELSMESASRRITA